MVQECSFSFNPLVGFRECVDIAPEPQSFFELIESIKILHGHVFVPVFIAFLLISVCTRPDRGLLAKE